MSGSLAPRRCISRIYDGSFGPYSLGLLQELGMEGISCTSPEELETTGQPGGGHVTELQSNSGLQAR